jgi:flagellar protein FlaG
VLREAKVKISSIASAIGTAPQLATSTKRADGAAGGPAPGENSIRRSEHLIDAATLATPNVPANSAEASDRVAPIVNGFRFLPQELKFLVDKETGRQIIQVVDVESGKMIRQIPAEDALNFIRQLKQRKGAVLSIKT